MRAAVAGMVLNRRRNSGTVGGVVVLMLLGSGTPFRGYPIEIDKEQRRGGEGTGNRDKNV
jgi:hypothetical protein